MKFSMRGEPLMNPHIVEMVEYAVSHHLTVPFAEASLARRMLLRHHLPSAVAFYVDGD